MKVLVVSSGNNKGINGLVRNQSESLRKAGIVVDNFLIKGRGITGYLKSIPKIRKEYYSGGYDLVHAHYLFSAVAASLAGRFPIVVSLMGSDIHMSGFFILIARLFHRFRWDITIVKTMEMKQKMRFDNIIVFPNGVDINVFKPIPVSEARKKTGFGSDYKSVVFIGDQNRKEKNFELASKAFENLRRDDVHLIPVFNVPGSEIPSFLNSADLLLLTSKYEGGVNVIKEAMACNIPIVSTDVGDVRWITENVEGCFITTFDYTDVADKIRLALEFGRKTNGRERIIKLGLDSDSVAEKLIILYQKLIAKAATEK